MSIDPTSVERIVPVSGSEASRQYDQAHGSGTSAMAAAELHTTTDQCRLLKAHQIQSGGKYLGTVATASARLGFNAANPHIGCWPGDYCRQATPPAVCTCISNHGESSDDWIVVRLDPLLPELNLAGLTDVPAAWTNLGLGSAACHAAGDFAAAGDIASSGVTLTAAGLIGATAAGAAVRIPLGANLSFYAGALVAAGGGGGSVPAWVANHPDTPPASPSSYDDEFDGISLDSKWTWVNQGSASVIFEASNAIMTMPASGSCNLHALVQTAPNTPYRITAKIVHDAVGLTSYNWVGLLLMSSTSGKIKAIGLMRDQDKSTCMALEVLGYNSVSSFGPTTAYVMAATQVIYLQIFNDGSILHFLHSVDGRHYIELYSEAIAAWLVDPDRMGIAADVMSASVAPELHCDWFRGTS